MSDHAIMNVQREVLSDGSAVFNVAVNLGLLHAISEKDALELTAKICTAVNSHTLESVDVTAD